MVHRNKLNLVQNGWLSFPNKYLINFGSCPLSSIKNSGNNTRYLQMTCSHISEASVLDYQQYCMHLDSLQLVMTTPVNTEQKSYTVKIVAYLVSDKCQNVY